MDIHQHDLHMIKCGNIIDLKQLNHLPVNVKMNDNIENISKIFTYTEAVILFVSIHPGEGATNAGR